MPSLFLKLIFAILLLPIMAAAQNPTKWLLESNERGKQLAKDQVASVVLKAYGGREGIETARRELPDVILLDLMMPDVSGFDVVAALQETPETADIPILVLTAGTVSISDRARLNGFVEAIMEQSDFGPGQFTDEVRRAMSGRRQVA